LQSNEASRIGAISIPKARGNRRESKGRASKAGAPFAGWIGLG
jgi:hypothetical protein